MISNFILLIGFIVILLGVFLIVTLVFTRKKRNELYLKHKDLTQKFQSQLLQAQIEVQEHTYRNIAKELHDNVGQLLSTTKMLMGVTEIKLGQVPETLTNANATLSKAIQEIRLLSRSLDKEWLEQFNFLENLQTEVQRINASGILKAQIEGVADLTMKPEEQIILFRIVQEGIQNAIRHAQPSKLSVLIEKYEKLEVKILNDGKPMPEQFHGMGTNNMRHRATLFGGSVRWETVGSYTIVTISLPIK